MPVTYYGYKYLVTNISTDTYFISNTKLGKHLLKHSSKSSTDVQFSYLNDIKQQGQWHAIMFKVNSDCNKCMTV